MSLALSTKEKILCDLNADGFFDVLISLPEEGSPEHHAVIKVWYEDQWRDVITSAKEAEGNKYRRILQEGGAVEFDIEKGRWLSSAGAFDSGRSNRDRENGNRAIGD